MHKLIVQQSPLLAAKVCFKSVWDWLEDAAAALGADPLIAVENLEYLSFDKNKCILFTAPVILSPLLTDTSPSVRDSAGRYPFPWGCCPVGSVMEIQAARRLMQEAINRYHMENGVDILDPSTTFIGPDVTIGKGTTILPGVVIQGKVSIGEGCEIGPFTHIRPDVSLDSHVKAGAFVEIKDSHLGTRSHADHLAYIGGAQVGRDVAFGCGSVTVNYNGVDKFRTVIKDDVFIGCNTNIIAPVTIHDGGYTAAGSTITEDVPPGALAIARARQINKPAWKSPKERQENLSNDRLGGTE